MYIYVAVHVSINPSCAPHLIAYQWIITSANSQHTLHVWLSYDMRFRTKAANDSSLRRDIRDLDLWLECFPSISPQANRWLCNYCGGTTNYPINCPFHSSPSHAPGRPQPATVNHQQKLTRYAKTSTGQTVTGTAANSCTGVRSVLGCTPPRAAWQRGSPVLIKFPPWTPLDHSFSNANYVTILTESLLDSF